MAMITVIGRGHGGTRAMSHTLSASGVYMGEPLNRSGDLIPPEAMYEACRVLGRTVQWLGGLEWDFSALHEGPIDPEFVRLIEKYLACLRSDSSENKGWKIPETTLAFPWIQRMYPDIRYIFWVRNPRDSILAPHVTDDLADFGVDYPRTDDPRRRRAISWKYQDDLIRATPKPKHWIKVRFEDFVLNQDRELARLEEFLGFPLAKIPVTPEPVGRWKADTGVNYFDFLARGMADHGYEKGL
jgi:Sulfotransferase family